MADDVFLDVKNKSFDSETPSENISRLQSLQLGFGSKVFRGDQSGIWLGAEKWADAPFRVDMDGNLTATSLTITGYLADGEAADDINSNVTTINADKINISGLTSFSSGYNPSEKIADSAYGTGGSYASAGSGARVLIFPDSNTGMQIIDDSGNNVFLANVGGTNVGDVVIGDYSSSNYVFYDKSDGSLNVRGTLNADDLNAGSIDASSITINNIDADKITSGDIGADRISVTDLASINADLGTITAGTIDAEDITVKNLTATNINRGTLSVGGSGNVGQIIISRGSQGDAYLRFGSSTGSRMWADTSSRIGINSLGSPMYIYVDSYERLVINSSGQNKINGGLRVTDTGGDGNVNIEGRCRVDERLYVGSGSSGYWSFNGDGEYELEGNLRINGYTTIRNTVWMNWHDIWEADNIKANNFDTYSAVYEGDDYKDILNSVKSDKKKTKTKRVKEKGERWEELNHSSLHPSLYSKDVKGEDGMSISNLIMVHNTAIKDMIKRIEELENKVKSLERKER